MEVSERERQLLSCLFEPSFAKELTSVRQKLKGAEEENECNHHHLQEKVQENIQLTDKCIRYLLVLRDTETRFGDVK